MISDVSTKGKQRITVHVAKQQDGYRERSVLFLLLKKETDYHCR